MCVTQILSKVVHLCMKRDHNTQPPPPPPPRLPGSSPLRARVPLSTQVYTWVPANVMTGIPTPGRFMQ